MRKQDGLAKEIVKLVGNHNAAVDAAVDGLGRSISYLMELHGAENVKKTLTRLLGSPEGCYGKWGSAITVAEKLLSAMRQKFGGHVERPSGG